MKRFVYRNCSLSLLIASIIVSNVVLILSIIGIYALFNDPTCLPVVRHIMTWIVGAGICFPCIIFIIASCIAFSERIVVSEDAVVFYRGKKQMGYIPCKQITVFGCAAFMHRNGYIFFCSEPIDSIMDFAQHHQEEMIHCFGKSRVEAVSKTEEGYRQIAIGTYVEISRKKNQKSIIILKNASSKQLNSVKLCLPLEPVLTGPIIMDYPAAGF